MLQPEYYVINGTISWLPMSWLLASPGHQQPWFWLCPSLPRLSISIISAPHGNEMTKCKNTFMFLENNLVYKELKQFRQSGNDVPLLEWSGNKLHWVILGHYSWLLHVLSPYNDVWLLWLRTGRILSICCTRLNIYNIPYRIIYIYTKLRHYRCYVSLIKYFPVAVWRSEPYVRS